MKTNTGLERQISVVIVAQTEDLQDIESIFESDDRFVVLATATDGEEGVKLTCTHSPDIVISSFALKLCDGLTLTEHIKVATPKTKVVMFSSAFSKTCIKRMVRSGVDFYVLSPFNSEALKTQIENIVYDDSEEELTNTENKDNDRQKNPTFIVRPDTQNAVTSTKTTQAARKLEEFTNEKKYSFIDERVANILIMIGIPANIHGYNYIREGVRQAIENQSIVNSITKQLYPAIAKRYLTSASKVERAIRHAIEVAWNRGRIESINEIFGVKAYNSKDKPTNGEFIALLADKMLFESINRMRG